MKILHIGAYDRNIGDTIALVNARKSWEQNTDKKIEWSGLDIGHFWHPNLKYSQILDYFKKVEGSVDAILFGGGGLVEYGGYENLPTEWKLPLNKEIIQSIEIPIFLHGVGVNIFRGGIEYSDTAKKHLQETIDFCGGFSVRNDGSLEKLRDWIGLDVSNVDIIPDPGLLYLECGIKNKQTVSVGGFQPAFNGSRGINQKRFINQDNIDFIVDFSEDYLMFPHTMKDYGHLKCQPVVTSDQFRDEYMKSSSIYKFLNHYPKVDYVVAMRGHGQLITIGMNIPGIYFTTQDKVRDFSLLNGYKDYNVDITEKDWQSKLLDVTERLTEPNSQLLKEWYEITKENLPKWYKQNNDFITKSLNKNGL